jgi:hypothetical protein
MQSDVSKEVVMEEVAAQKEHQWLTRLVGDWTYETEASMGPDKPPAKFAGKETVRSLGGIWIICEGSGEMPGGGTATMMMTLGYDPVKKRFVGTFFASMMTHLWIYEGSLDPAGSVLTLEAEGPSCTGDGSLAKYKDVIELADDGRRKLSSNMLGEDGNWHCFMTANYRRVK